MDAEEGVARAIELESMCSRLGGVKDRDGNVLMSEERVLGCKEYFEELLDEENEKERTDERQLLNHEV